MSAVFIWFRENTIMTHKLAALVFVLTLTSPAFSQKAALLPKSSLCTRDNALDTINQQILTSRTIDDQVRRISVLISAADLLWPYQKQKSLATFNEAFSLAVQSHKAGDPEKKVSGNQFLRIDVPDQRHKVVAAVAKRDPRTARSFLDQIFEEDARADADKPDTAESSFKNSEKILSLAMSLTDTDVASAVNFARLSFKYKASLYLPFFLFSLAKTNRSVADSFYLEALNNYATAPMDQFLYLSSYPFGNTRDAGDMPGSAYYQVPTGFVPNVAHQQEFIRRLLSRAQLAFESPVDDSVNYRLSDLAQMWLAFSRLDTQIRTNLPELADDAFQTREKIFALLNSTSQQRVNASVSQESEPQKRFDELVEAALKKSDVGMRDRDLTFAVTRSSKDETVERVTNVIDKISESSIRESLTNWFYLFRAQALTKEKKFNEARELAAKVPDLDQRAYLFSRIAEGSLKEQIDQIQARELLNEIATAGAKAPQTISTGRALLALAYLYSKIDANRGLEELANAVRVINGINNPDFSQQYVIVKIEGKTFGTYASISTPGFNPETAFAEVSKVDFDGALSQSTSFTEKSLRSLTTLAVVEPCLLQAPKTQTPKRKS